MFITPITPMIPLGQISGAKQVSANEGTNGNLAPFQEIFSNAIQNLKETEITSNNDTELLASGDIDDLHTLGINATKAYLAERLVIEMRNRALEAYSEMMRINL